MRAILLDLDDTLLDESSAAGAGFVALVAAHCARLPAVGEEALRAAWRAIAHRHWSRMERGELTFQEQRRERMREFLGVPLSAAEADEAFRPFVEAHEAAWRLLPEAAALLAQIAGFPKAVVTNGERALQLRKLAATGLSDHFAVVMTPDDCGCWKPNPRIFLDAAQSLGVAPRDCLMIGDDEARDIEPARRLGMKAFHVVPGDPERSLLKALAAL